MFDLIMLYWVLPTCVVFLAMIGRLRNISPLSTNDWGFTTLFSVFWPIGGVIVVGAEVYDVYLQVGGRYKVYLIKVGSLLTKERKL